jgi:dethiobiotin synthetase
MTRGLFVTGTDTGVGKTLAACALLHALSARGIQAHPMKPIAAGDAPHRGRRANPDTLALMLAAGLGADSLDEITPVLLAEPIAPHIAAAREGRAISLDPVRAAYERVRGRSSFVVVEGVGGFLVPLGGDIDTVDLAQAFRLPVVLVVGLRLGCLNHALLTERAIEASGLPFAGWIANLLDPAMLAVDENLAALRERLPGPLLGCLPHRVPPDPRQLASEIDVGPILERHA